MTDQIEKIQKEVEMECIKVLARHTNQVIEETEEIVRKTLAKDNGLMEAKNGLEFLNYQYELIKQIQKEINKYENKKLTEV